MKKILILTQISALFVFGTCYAAPDSNISGTVHLTAKHITAHHLNGNPYPEYDEQCANEYHYQLKTAAMDVTYVVDPATQIEQAEASLLGQKVRLYPLGVNPGHHFLSDGVPAGLAGIDRVSFSIGKSFTRKSAKGFIMYLSHASDDASCVIDMK